MDTEVVNRGKDIWEKLSAFHLAQMTMMDWIFLAGAVTLIILAVKIVSRFFKVIFVLLAIGLLAAWLFSTGILSI